MYHNDGEIYRPYDYYNLCDMWLDDTPLADFLYDYDEYFVVKYNIVGYKRCIEYKNGWRGYLEEDKVIG